MLSTSRISNFQIQDSISDNSDGLFSTLSIPNYAGGYRFLIVELSWRSTRASTCFETFSTAPLLTFEIQQRLQNKLNSSFSSRLGFTTLSSIGISREVENLFTVY